MKNGKPLTGCSSLDLLPDHARRCDVRDTKQLRHRYAIIHSNGEYKLSEKNDVDEKDIMIQSKRKGKGKGSKADTASNSQLGTVLVPITWCNYRDPMTKRSKNLQIHQVLVLHPQEYRLREKEIVLLQRIIAIVSL